MAAFQPFNKFYGASERLMMQKSKLASISRFLLGRLFHGTIHSDIAGFFFKLPHEAAQTKNQRPKWSKYIGSCQKNAQRLTARIGSRQTTFKRGFIVWRTNRQVAAPVNRSLIRIQISSEGGLELRTILLGGTRRGSSSWIHLLARCGAGNQMLPPLILCKLYVHVYISLVQSSEHE